MFYYYFPDVMTEIVGYETLNRYSEREIFNLTFDGGCKDIENNLCRFLYPILGCTSIDQYRSAYSHHLKSIRTSVHLWRKGDTKFECNYNLTKKYELLTGSTIDSVTEKYQDQGVYFRNGYMFLKESCIQGIVHPVIAEITCNVKNAVKLNCNDISAIFLVTTDQTFTPFLHSELESTFFMGGIDIIVPHDPHLAIIQGAVLYGHNSDLTCRHFLNKTYGIGMEPEWNMRLNNAPKQRQTPIREYISDVFDICVVQGEPIKCGFKISKTFTPSQPNCKSLSFGILCLDVNKCEQMENLDQRLFKRIGTLKLCTPPNSDTNRCEVILDLLFAVTEFWVTAKDTRSGNVAEMSFAIE